ncbi:hypothetical protein CM49_01978 [Paenibacillus sp. P1XP2]|nr:hypothetical protein CM49_01978 [Paenibacillus sp. P1XP2]
MRDHGCAGLEANRKRCPRQQREGGKRGSIGNQAYAHNANAYISFGWFFYYQEER